MSSSRSKRSFGIRHRKNSRGIALLAVLWVLLLLSALAAAATFLARTNAVLIHHSGVIAQAQAGADAAILDAISKLSDENAERHPSLGAVGSFNFEQISVAVQVRNEDGRIDLNSAGDDLLLAFLQSQGVSQDASSTMLRDLRVSQGAVPGGSLRGNGLGTLRPDVSVASELLEPLQSADEVRRLPSWSTQPLDCWLEYFTVYTRNPGVSSQDAVPQVMAALRWAQEHHLSNRNWTSDSPSPSSATTRSMIGEVLRISAAATAGNQVSVTSEWVGRLTGESRRPFLTLRWIHSKPAPTSCSSPTL